MKKIVQIVPTSDLLFRQSFLRLVNHAKTIESSGGGEHDRWLITGGWAMSQLIEDRGLKDIDIWAEGPLAPREGKGNDRKEHSELKKHLLTEMRGRFLNRNLRGWNERYSTKEGRVTVLYDYTRKKLSEHPRSRILAEIDEHNLPFADRDDLFTSSHEVSTREKAM